MTRDDVPTRRPGGSPPIAARVRRATYPLAALLFAAASVVGYMSQNLSETAVPDVLPALGGAVAAAAAVWLVVLALHRRADAFAAAVAALWVAAGVYYVGLFGALNIRIGGAYSMVLMLPVALAGLAVATFALHRLRGLAAPVHVVLSVLAAVLLATPLVKVAAYEWRNGAARAVYDPDRAAAELVELAGPIAAPADGAARPPDIYHFLFDRYGSAETMNDPYGITATIGERLAERGFFVAEDSHSNYLKTGQSLASTFYLDYLDLLDRDPRIDGSSWHPIYAMLEDHRAARFLRDQGYEVLQYGSWWKGTHRNVVADGNRPYGFNEFTMYYLRQTVLRTALAFAPGSDFARRLDWDNGQCQRVARQIEEIKAIGARDKPVYVFAHLLIPHDPMVFGPDGSCLSFAESTARGGAQGYADQVAYADKIITDVVGALQDRPAPPVILIQADEGPYPVRDYDIPWQDAAPKELAIKSGILSAYYFPDGEYSALYPDISPVNSYRVLFDKYFGADLPLLPDRLMVFPVDGKFYEFHDATERLRGAAPVRAGLDGSGEAEPAGTATPELR